MASNVSSYDSTGGRCSIPVQSMCDSWSTNWHRDKCFAAVLRLPSTDHLISSWRWTMEPVQAAAPRRSRPMARQWKRNKVSDKYRKQRSRHGITFHYQVILVVDGFHTKGIKKISTPVCASLNRWHISWGRLIQTFFKRLLSKHCACVNACVSLIHRRNSDTCNREVIHPVVFAIWPVV